MDPTVVLEHTQVSVEPGNRSSVTARILNPNPVVERYRVDVVGEPAQWALVIPPEVSVFPGEETSVEIAFDPPASAKVPAGTLPFGVRVRSEVDPNDSTVVECTLQLGGFQNVTASIGPKTSRGRRSGRHHVDVSNWGNEPMTVELTASDPDERLRFSIQREVFELPIGASASCKLKVRSVDTSLRGPAVRKPFVVTAREAGRAPDDTSGWQRELDAAFEQRALLPGWVVAVAVLAVAAAAGVAVWLSMRDDDVQSTASDAAAAPPSEPASFVVAPAGPGGLTATWEPVAAADGYNLLWIEPATRDAPTPTVFRTTPVAGTDNAHVEEDLDPSTEYCLQVSATNAAGESTRSAPQCTTTLDESSAAAPTGLEVAQVGDDRSRAELSWTDATGGEAEHVVLHDGVPLDQPIPAGVTSAVVDLKSGENCFRVYSQQGDEASEISDEVCIDGPGTSDGGGATGTTGATTGADDLGWITVVFSTPVDDTGARQRAEEARGELEAEGHVAAILNTLDYENLADGPDGAGFLFVFIGGFESEDEARGYCEANFDVTCLQREPGPSSPG